MLTVDLDRLGAGRGDLVLDLGCGSGRHALALCERGVQVVALDRDHTAVGTTGEWLAAMRAEGAARRGVPASVLVGDACRLPFATGVFDAVIAAEILEHLPHDTRAMAEVARVCRPGGRVAVTVPRFGPEVVCWALSSAYHEVEGGHVRIYRRRRLVAGLARAGLTVTGREHVHGLHAPYWWLRCLVGPDRDEVLPVRLYHRLLVWDIEHSPWVTRALERLLDPLVGKSLVLYLERDGRAGA